MYDLFLDGTALWFTIPAFLGSAVFVLKIGLMLAGGIGAGDMADGINGDALGDFDPDADGSLAQAIDGADDIGDSTAAFKALSVLSVATFLMGFGWGGLGAIKGLGYDLTVGLVVAIACGLGMVWLLGWMLRKVYMLQSSGTVSIHSAVGHNAQVYVTAPAHGGGAGQVSVVIGDRQRILNAVSAGPEIPRNATVRITGVNADNTVTIEPA